MKSKMKFCLTLSTIIILCLLTVACSGTSANDKDAIVGTWNLVTIADGSTEIPAKDYMASAKLTKVPQMTFLGDNKVTFDTGKNAGTSKWEKKDALYIITDETQKPPVTMQFTLKNNRFAIAQGEYQLTFEKQLQ